MSEQHTRAEVMTGGRWLVDIEESRATFSVRGLFGTVHGTVPILAGVVEVGDDAVPGSVAASLDLSGIETGIARRDQDLRSPRLLDLDNHPVMTFSADHFGEGLVEGRLAARGTSTTIAGQVNLTPESGDDLQIVRATCTFDRRSLGIQAPRFLIGHAINVSVVARLSRA